MVHRHRHLGAVHFRWGDNTWADAHSNYFYYAWCDRSRTWAKTLASNTNYHGQARPDADVKFAKIRQ